MTVDLVISLPKIKNTVYTLCIYGSGQLYTNPTPLPSPWIPGSRMPTSKRIKSQLHMCQHTLTPPSICHLPSARSAHTPCPQHTHEITTTHMPTNAHTPFHLPGQHTPHTPSLSPEPVAHLPQHRLLPMLLARTRGSLVSNILLVQFTFYKRDTSFLSLRPIRLSPCC